MSQLATYDEARDIAKQLGSIGGGVIDTYIPEHEGPFAPQEDGPAKLLYFAFVNGATGINVGLIRDLIRLCPMRWPIMIGTEVEAARRR